MPSLMPDRYLWRPPRARAASSIGPLYGGDAVPQPARVELGRRVGGPLPPGGHPHPPGGPRQEPEVTVGVAERVIVDLRGLGPRAAPPGPVERGEQAVPLHDRPA